MKVAEKELRRLLAEGIQYAKKGKTYQRTAVGIALAHFLKVLEQEYNQK